MPQGTTISLPGEGPLGGTVPQDLHENGDGRRWGKKTDARVGTRCGGRGSKNRHQQGWLGRRVKTTQHGPCPTKPAGVTRGLATAQRTMIGVSPGEIRTVRWVRDQDPPLTEMTGVSHINHSTRITQLTLCTVQFLTTGASRLHKTDRVRRITKSQGCPELGQQDEQDGRQNHLGDRRVRADEGTTRTARPRTRDEKGRRGAKASHTDSSSRWQDEDAARRLSATSRTRSMVGAPGSMFVTSLKRRGRCDVTRP
ncbi:hypothetical protein CF327_g2672 [Tilletia walkeri]|nr:hypothetical protein CF327_g2672 [Tilletia walkeri]